MRMLAASALILLGYAVLPAKDDADAKKIVESAIAKIGGAEKLTELKSGIWKTSGVFQAKQSKSEFRGEIPGRFRIDSTRIVNGEPVKSARIIDGDKGWLVTGDEVRDMTAEQIAGVKNSFYHKQCAATLVPLLDKECTLTKLGGADIEGKATTIIKATRTGKPDLLLFFDDKTGLVVKSMMDEKNEVSGQSHKVEVFYSDYKQFGEIKMAGHVKSLRDGKPFQEADYTEFKGSKDPLPTGTFAPPVKK